MIHPLLVVGRDRICRWKRQDKLLEEIGYVVETISISGRISAVMHQLLSSLLFFDYLSGNLLTIGKQNLLYNQALSLCADALTRQIVGYDIRFSEGIDCTISDTRTGICLSYLHIVLKRTHIN